MICEGLVQNPFLNNLREKEEIWLSPMTKAPTSTEKYKTQRNNNKNKTTPKLQLHNDCGPTSDGQL